MTITAAPSRWRTMSWVNALALFGSKPGVGSAMRPPSSANEHAAHAGKPLGQELPGDTAVAGMVEPAVLGTEDHQLSGCRQARGVDVVVEPLGQALTTALELARAVEGLAIERRAPAAGTGGDREQQGCVGNGHGARVVGVEAGGFEAPGIAAITAHPEPVEGGDHHGLRVGGRDDDLVDIDVEVERRRPGAAAVAGADDTANVNVDVDAPIGRVHGQGAHIGRITPGRVPGLAAFDAIEGLEALEPIAHQPEEMSGLGADKESTDVRGQARRRRSLDRRALLPALALLDPHLTAVDQRPRLPGVAGQGRDCPARERFSGGALVYAELPHSAVGPDQNSRFHASHGTPRAPVALAGHRFLLPQLPRARVRARDGRVRLLRLFGIEIGHRPQGQRLLQQALALGPVTYLDPEEAKKTDAAVSGTYARPWELWKKKTMAR